MNSDTLAIFRRRQIGIVYQFYNLIPILTVEENITLPCDLDTKASEDIMNLLKISNRTYNQTIIMITHDLELAKQADRIITISDGRIVEES